MRKTKLIITDLDGTLINTFKANFLAYKEVLKIYNILLTEEEYKKNYGLPFHEMLKNIKNKAFFNKEPTIEEINSIKALKAREYKRLLNKTILNNHLYKTLKYHKKDSYIALATGASKENSTAVLEYHNILSLFDLILTAADVINSKPHPEIFLKAINYFKVEKKNTIVYEDSEIGIQAAISAGVSNIIKIVLLS